VLNDLQAPSELQLRVGCQVMLLANLDVKGGLVNGSRGVVTGFANVEDARQELTPQALMRGLRMVEESGEWDALQTFLGGNNPKLFPRVLFETKNVTKEVRVLYPSLWNMWFGG